MNYSGILVGAAVFLSIGICHPLVIKMEYQWGKQSWWVWLVAGLAFCTLSLFVRNDILSIIIGGLAFCGEENLDFLQAQVLFAEDVVKCRNHRERPFGKRIQR